jgi:hypothetical protein
LLGKLTEPPEPSKTQFEPPDSNPAFDNGIRAPDNVALCPSGLVTVTCVSPAEWAGVNAVIVDESTTSTPVAAVPPKVTFAPVTKLLPDNFTAVPPSTVPDCGLMEIRVGAGSDEPD